MIKKCLFPAAGYGTRFLPATKSIPKEMLPIVNKPLIHYGIDEARKAGIYEFGFVTGRSKRAIEDYLDYNPEIETSIKGSSKEKLLEDTTKDSAEYKIIKAVENGKARMDGDEENPRNRGIQADLCNQPRRYF